MNKRMRVACAKVVLCTFAGMVVLPGCNSGKDVTDSGAPARPVIGKLAGAPSPAPAVAPVTPPAAAPGTAAVTRAGAGDPLTNAKELMAKMQGIKKLDDLPELLSNETAATMGLAFSLMIYMVAAMSDAFAGMAKSMAQGMASGMGGTTPTPAKPDPKAEKEMAAFKGMKKDMEALFKKYGVPEPATLASQKDNSIARTLAPRGRAFFTEVLAALKKLPEGSAKKGLELKPDKKPFDLKDVRYTVVDPTHVKIVDKINGKDETMEARVEDGKWRLHIPDIDKLMQGKGGAAAPKMGGMQPIPGGMQPIPGGMGAMPGMK